MSKISVFPSGRSILIVPNSDTESTITSIGCPNGSYTVIVSPLTGESAASSVGSGSTAGIPPVVSSTATLANSFLRYVLAAASPSSLSILSYSDWNCSKVSLPCGSVVGATSDLVASSFAASSFLASAAASFLSFIACLFSFSISRIPFSTLSVNSCLASTFSIVLAILFFSVLISVAEGLLISGLATSSRKLSTTEPAST